MSAKNAGVNATGRSRTYLACSEYVNGTHTRSPNTSMNPNPSVVTSMVVRMAGSNQSASATYKA